MGSFGSWEAPRAPENMISKVCHGSTRIRADQNQPARIGSRTPGFARRDSRGELSPHEPLTLPSALGFGGGLLAHPRADFERHLAGFLVGVDDDVIAVEDFAVEDL